MSFRIFLHTVLSVRPLPVDLSWCIVESVCHLWSRSLWISVLCGGGRFLSWLSARYYHDVYQWSRPWMWDKDHGRWSGHPWKSRMWLFGGRKPFLFPLMVKMSHWSSSFLYQRAKSVIWFHIKSSEVAEEGIANASDTLQTSTSTPCYKCKWLLWLCLKTCSGYRSSCGLCTG